MDDGERATALTYRDVYHQNEVEQSTYNFEQSNAPMLFQHFSDLRSRGQAPDGEAQLALPGYEMVLKAAHTFNLLDARGAISVTERAAYIGRIRTLARRGAGLFRFARGARLSDAARPSSARDRHERGHAVVELFTEELPPKALKRLGEAFADGIAAGLRERGSCARERLGRRVFATPRRLAVAITASARRRAGRGGRTRN